MSRVFALVFATLFFAALPLWAFSHQRGRVLVDAHRQRADEPFHVRVTTNFAFASSVETFDSRKATILFAPGTARRARGQAIFQFEREGALAAPVLSVEVPSTANSASALEPLAEAGKSFEDAVKSGALDFTWTFPPEGSFWLLLALTILFAGAGASLVLFTGSRRT